MDEDQSRDAHDPKHSATPPALTDRGALGAAGLERLADLLATIPVTRDRRLVEDMVLSTLGLIEDGADTLNLKIAASAIREMREAFEMFQPYSGAPKVAIFGSARTKSDDPLYAQAREVAALLAAEDWMVITGAGPGIMQAAMEGAGRERSIGVSIRLPFEQGANPVIAGDSKYVSMKYFFTRKLMLIKEAKAFVCLPGGFGTLDETFELLTLTQTGKGVPVPIVLLNIPGDRYWDAVVEFMRDHLVSRHLVRPADLDLFLMADSPAEAVREIVQFYANYHSLRYVGDRLVIRLRREPTDEQVEQLNAQFGQLCVSGRIERSRALSVEVREHDVVELPRIAFHFAKHGFGDLHNMIDLLNSFA